MLLFVKKLDNISFGRHKICIMFIRKILYGLVCTLGAVSNLLSSDQFSNSCKKFTIDDITYSWNVKLDQKTLGHVSMFLNVDDIGSMVNSSVNVKRALLSVKRSIACNTADDVDRLIVSISNGSLPQIQTLVIASEDSLRHVLSCCVYISNTSINNLEIAFECLQNSDIMNVVANILQNTQKITTVKIKNGNGYVKMYRDKLLHRP